MTEGDYAIYADHVVINGGVVTTTNQGYGNGIYGYYDVTINGGIVTANASAHYDGIYTQGTITLGWTNESDRITASSYYGEVTIASGQAFSDETGHCYFNTLTDSQIAAIAGQTLSPFNDFGATFTITYVTNGGTLPEGYPATYTFAETVTLPIPTKEENTFAGWYDNATFEGDPVTEIEAGTALGNKTFYACWKPEYIDVTYLDADGQTQTAHAKVLYGGYDTGEYEYEYEGGVYTVLAESENSPVYDILHFTGDATLILPDESVLGVVKFGKEPTDEETGLHVDGNLTIFGQEKGSGVLYAGLIHAGGDVNIYGGVIYTMLDLTSNDGNGTITLSWTALANALAISEYNGTVVLSKAFRTYNNNEESIIIPAGQVSDNNTINAKYLTPYAETLDVSYIDENGATHTVNAHVLYGGETILDGGYYTVMSIVSYDHPLSFEGNTTLIIPDGSYLFFEINSDDNGGIYPVEGNGITVNGNLAIYGQAGRNGYIEINATDAAVYATGDVTVSNLYFDYDPYSTYCILSGGDILIAGYYFKSWSNLRANAGNGTITLGYLTEYDYIECSGYEGTVVVRDGQKLYYYDNEYNPVIISGTLTAEEVAAIAGEELHPYIEPITLTVEGYGESTTSGWVFIASPIMGSIAPTEVGNIFSASEYDLYRLNPSTMMWENYKEQTGNAAPGFNLENGRGYLYATKETEILEFTGVSNPGTTSTTTLGQGWNLVGNPFNANVTLDRSYYVMNGDGSGILATAMEEMVQIKPCTGVIVQATGADESVTFTRAATRGIEASGQGNISIVLSQNGSMLDKAIVSFNEGDKLGKFYFLEQDANIYIPQGDEEYAIAYSNGAGEMPLNFKAKETGTYTIAVETRGRASLHGVHLIDILVGEDIDLGETPTYTFIGSVADSEARFKIVFGASTGSESEIFVYQSGEEIIVSGEGELQVSDMLGRVVLHRQVNGVETMAKPSQTGVYIFKLNEKTQKIVIF